MSSDTSTPKKKNSGRTVGILGGSFNPIHLGHIRICETVLAKFPVEKCLLMPNYQSPLKSMGSTAPEHRLKMIQLAIEEYKELGLDYSTWELDQKRVSYTVDTLKHFQDQGQNTLFVMGADTFRDIAAWKEYRKLFGLADFAIVSRPSHTSLDPSAMIPLTLANQLRMVNETELEHTSGHRVTFITMTPFTLSSSELRGRLAAGLDCSGLIPESVLNYIHRNRLYTLEPEIVAEV